MSKGYHSFAAFYLYLHPTSIQVFSCQKKNSTEKLLLKELNCIQSFIEVSAAIMFPTWKMHYFISYYLYSVYFPYLITVLFIDNLKSVILIHVSSSSKTSTN